MGARKEAEEKKLEKAAKAREPPCGDDNYCKSIKEWAEILAALEKKSKAAAKEAASTEAAEKGATEERKAKGAAEKDKLAEDWGARIAQEKEAKAEREKSREAKA